MGSRCFLISIFLFFSINAFGVRKVTFEVCAKTISHYPLDLDLLFNQLFVPTRGKVNPPDLKIAEKLAPRLVQTQGWISPETASSWKEEFKTEENDFLMSLAEAAKKLAKPPISNYFVGQAARAGSGRVYWAVNVEFPGLALNHTIHGEQFMVAQFLLNGETHLKTLALLGAPCGHCRQFLRELKFWKELKILMPGQPPFYLSELLPKSFGPEVLGTSMALLDSPVWSVEAVGKTTAQKEAIRIASLSYAPYTKNPSGAVLRSKKGVLYRGMNIDNVAFNPSLNALSVAFVDLISRQGSFEDIEEAVLAEEVDGKKSEYSFFKSVISKICPQAKITLLDLKKR